MTVIDDGDDGDAGEDGDDCDDGDDSDGGDDSEDGDVMTAWQGHGGRARQGGMTGGMAGEHDRGMTGGTSSLPRITASHHCHAPLPTNSHLTPPPPHSALSLAAHTLTYLVCVLGEEEEMLWAIRCMVRCMVCMASIMHGGTILAHPRTSFHTLAPLTYL